jgi:chromosome segregation ATPase
MGGTDVNSESIKNNDPVQLRQMIIFLKAELAKYKHEVKKYHESYHYSLAEKLEQEIVQLMNEKNALSEELHVLHEEFEKRTSEYDERIHLHEIQGKMYITSIDTLRKTKTGLWTTNKQLTEVIKDLKDRLDTELYNDRQISSLDSKISEYKTTIEQLEYRLVHVIQETNKQVQYQIEKLDMTNQEHSQSEKMQRHLLKEIEEKNNTIGKLQHELLDLQEQKKKLEVEKSRSRKIVISTTPPTIDTKSLMQLDHQIKELLAKSMDYEEQLDAKLLVLNKLEHKLNQLTVEIDDIKVFSIEGRVLKEL